MKPLVSIISLTYNHEPFIARALEGFLIQKTNFSFEVIVHDDASTDKTQSIIKDYEKRFPKIVKPIYQRENQKSKGNGIVSRTAFAAAEGKYIALCEGDDYWTDPFKLQKQVDFLENNPKYSICFHNAMIIDENNSITGEFTKGDFDTLDGLFILNNRVIPTASAVFINKKLVFPEWYNRTPFGETSLFVMITADGSLIKYINETMSVYRKHSGGIMNTFGSDEHYSRVIDTFKGMNSYLNFKYDRLFKEKIADAYLYRAKIAKNKGLVEESLNHLWSCTKFLFKARRRIGRLHLSLLLPILFKKSF